MIKGLNRANIFAIIADLIGSAVLVIYALIVGPLGVLRGPIAFERLAWYLWVLIPQGLLARSIRTAVDWRFGNFDAAIAQLEGLVGANEEFYREKPQSRARRRVLEDLYTVLARAYLHAGHIDDAMLVVIRAKKSMSVDRLTGLAELDAKTAHLVRAGLAAGRLLEGGGLATMFVKSNQPEPAQSPKQDGGRGVKRRPRPENRQGASKDGSRPSGGGASEGPLQSQGSAEAGMRRTLEGGKVIPFPSRAATSETPDLETT